MLGAANLEQFLGAVQGRRTLVVGDLLLDHYVRGHASRISPEAPVPVVLMRTEEQRLGGAGNVACNLRALGCEVRLCSVVGDDEDGSVLERMLTQKGIQGVLVSEPGRMTSRKTRVLAGGQQILRLDRETVAVPGPESESRFLKRLDHELKWAEAVFVADYHKGTVTDRVLSSFLPATTARPVYVDPGGRDYRRYQGTTILKPNQKEAELATGLEIVDSKSLDQAGRLLLELSGAELVLITRGGLGMSFFEKATRRLDVPVHTRDVFDVTGAGDTVLALIGAGHLCGLGFARAARLATVAAGVVIQKVGAVVAEIFELKRAVGLQQRNEKELDFEQAVAAIQRARSDGKRIVFTNGCFDILHAGHMHLLRKAKEFGDLLVVGLNTDRSIREIKGPKRPVCPQHERSQILAALDAVGLVVLFDEPTPVELIRKLQPDVLVKGADYTRDQVVGGDLVEAGGGRVELVELSEGKSTTGLIERIVELYVPATAPPLSRQEETADAPVPAQNRPVRSEPSWSFDNETVERTVQELIEARFKNYETLADLTRHKLSEKISATARSLISCVFSGAKILICGNGGSAADAQHFATELVIQYRRRRRALPAIALTTDSSILTAAANDTGFESIFERQIEALAGPGDALIALSTSGDSENVLRAMAAARKRDMIVVGLTGDDGGRMVEFPALAEGNRPVHLLQVPSCRTDEIQQMHNLILHIVGELMEFASLASERSERLVSVASH